MAIKESLLKALQVIGLQDSLRAVTSAGESRNVSVSNVAKTIIEDYTLESLAGSPQSVADAIDGIAENVSSISTSLDNLEIDDEVLELYESIGWTPPNVVANNTYSG